MTSVEPVKIPEGYKQTEVGVIPDDWNVKALELLGNGKTPPIKAGPFGSSLTKDIYVANGYKVYGQEQVIKGDHRYGDYYITPQKYKELSSCAVKAGDILLSLVGTAGKLLIITPDAEEGVINPRLLRFSFDKKIINSMFFKFLFESDFVQSLLSRSAQGGTMAVLNAGMLRILEIPVPPEKEQTAIANALSDVDNLIASLETLIAKKSAIKTAAMQQLLTGKKRLPGFVHKSENKAVTESGKESEKQGSDQLTGSGSINQATQPEASKISDSLTKCAGQTVPRPGYKQTELGEIPEDWEVVELLGVVNLYHGKAHEPFVVEGGEYTVVNSKFVSTEGRVRKTCNQNVCPARVDDVLMVLSDLPNGKALAKCYLVEAENTYAVNQRVCIYRSVKVDPKFLFYRINRHDFFLGLDDGVTQTHILNGDIAAFKLFLPANKKEQAAIANVLSNMDTELGALQQRLSKTQKIKQGMMKELLTGKTRLV